MNEEQLKTLLEANNAVLFGQLSKHIDKRLEENNAVLAERFDTRLEENNAILTERFDKRLEERLEQKLTEKLEQNNAVLFGQLSRHLDSRFNAFREEINEAVNRIYAIVDSSAKRIGTVEQEAAASEYTQRRHTGWILQVADKTKTQLIPKP